MAETKADTHTACHPAITVGEKNTDRRRGKAVLVEL
jgi:hypothetical protein